MTAFVDTSVLVRYLTGDPPDMLESARHIVDEVDPLTIGEVVLAETAYVLLSFYRIPRETVMDALIDLVQKANIHVHRLDKATVVKALDRCRPCGRVSPADALLWATAQDVSTTGTPAIVYSFDHRFPEDGIRVCDAVVDDGRADTS